MPDCTDPTVVTVPPVWRHQGHRLERLAGDAGPVLMADGERAKTLQTVSRLYEAFAKRRVTRSSTIVAFGGGVAGDAAGFAAATYLRGVPLVQVPTTLLAQVDSAIGGKVGVNLPAGKNLAGAFHAPSLVLCDPDVLDTLPRREFRAGLYEVVKYGVALSRDVFDQLAGTARPRSSRAITDSLLPLITQCCRIKADVVGRDEREAGPRRVLNFGHTIGHALEAVTRLPAVPPRRSGRLRHAGRRAHLGGARPDARCGSEPVAGTHSPDGPAPSGVRPAAIRGARCCDLRQEDRPRPAAFRPLRRPRRHADRRGRRRRRN